MKVPLSWLKQFIPLTQTAQEIACSLTNLGIEVEAITGHEATFEGIVVGKVLSAEKHPNADRLRVAKVTDGEGEYRVVCGAPNCREGIKVAFARVGAHLTDDDGKIWKIKKSKIRDVESEGMLCSSKELKLSDDHEGIVELSSDIPLGTDVRAVVLDPIFDLSLTPNLGHCQSVLGVARELAASLNLKLHLVEPKVQVAGNEKIDVQIENQEECPRFSCRIMRGVQVGPSPAWLQQRLTQCGLRSINTIVDISNYVMLELGHGGHIFDLDKIEGSIAIKQAPASFQFQTLDRSTREIPAQTLLICDQKGPLSLAGIMGGLSSAVTTTTQNILIEAASFNPQTIRKSSRLLDLKTDASSRFARGIDEASTPRVLDRIAELICMVGGGEVHPIMDKYPRRKEARTITCRPSRIEQILGISLSLGEILSIFERLEMNVVQGEEGLYVTVPSYRNDLKIEVDLIEEVARLYGYGKIPKHCPVYSSGALTDAPLFLLETKAREILLKEGLQECITCDLISPAEHEQAVERHLPDASTLRVLHPRSMDQSVLRTSLLPGLLKVVGHNFNHQHHDLSLFEIGRIHFREGDIIEEPSCAAILLTGFSRHPHFDRKPQLFDFFDLKGIIENFASALQLKEVQYASSNLHTLHPWRQAQVKVGDVLIGVFGEIHPDIVLKSHLQGRLFFAELNLNDILELKKKPFRFQPLATYPSSSRDWTVTVSNYHSYATLASLIQSSASPHMESFEMIDSFTSAELGSDQKNVTFRFIYRDRHKTITDETVHEEHRKLIHSVAEKLSNLV